MNCPFCAHVARDLFGIALHLEDEHPDKMNGIDLVVPSTAELCIRLPVARDIVWMDAIYLRRPDLIKPRSAP